MGEKSQNFSSGAEKEGILPLIFRLPSIPLHSHERPDRQPE